MHFQRHLALSLSLLASVVSGSLVDDIVNAIENAVDCGSCHALLVPLQGLALLGDSTFSNTFIAVCKALKLEDADVCQGAVEQQGPILAHDLRSISAFGQTATKLCDAVFGLCQPPTVNKYTVPIPKPAPANPKQFVSTGKPPIQVAHFSDVHIDRKYTPGSDATCNKPICCRNFSDSPSTVTTPAGPMGMHGCDTPAQLAQSMLNAISANNVFSIFTGDVVDAAIWLLNQDDVTVDLETFNNEMATILGAPVYPAVGNHESAPVNSFPRNTTTKSSSQWVFDIESKGWAKWISAAGANQVAHFSGSYSVVPAATNLRIISINTVYWYKANFWLYDSDTLQPDPNGILAFTAQELQAAEDAGQRAWIIAHMPPGRQDTLDDQSSYFDQIVQRYKNTIAAQFYGHSHKDEFAISYSDYAHQGADTAVSVAWIAPSLTPRNGNSMFKVYDVDPDTYEIMDARVFRADLSQPSFQSNPTWDLYYSARQSFGPLVGVKPEEPLGPAFWHKVTEAFATNDTAFQQYNTFKTGGFGVKECDAECKRITICDLRALRSQNNCDNAEPGLNFRRRNVDNSIAGVVHEQPCEGTGLSHILSRLPNRLTDEERTALRQQIKDAVSGSQGRL